MAKFKYKKKDPQNSDPKNKKEDYYSQAYKELEKGYIDEDFFKEHNINYEGGSDIGVLNELLVRKAEEVDFKEGEYDGFVIKKRENDLLIIPTQSTIDYLDNAGLFDERKKFKQNLGTSNSDLTPLDFQYSTVLDFRKPRTPMPEFVKKGIEAGLELQPFTVSSTGRYNNYMFKKPEQEPVETPPAERPKQKIVKAAPKKMSLSNNKLKLKKPVEEELIDITYTQGGDKVKVQTNYGDKVMSRKDYVDYSRQNQDKVQSYRKRKYKRR